MPATAKAAAPQRRLRFSLVPGPFAICRLEPDASIPAWATKGDVFCVTRTPDELSIVCAADKVPPGVSADRDWLCLKLHGPFALTESGVLAAFIAPLAEAQVSMLAVSTYDTDYVFIQEESWIALAALQAVGHELA
jgi:uncharacterized protein